MAPLRLGVLVLQRLGQHHRRAHGHGKWSLVRRQRGQPRARLLLRLLSAADGDEHEVLRQPGEWRRTHRLGPREGMTMTIRKLLVLLAAICVLVPAATAVLAGASDATSDAIPVRSDELSALSDDMAILRDASKTDGPVDVADLHGAPIMADDVIALDDARQVADSELLVAPTTDGSGLCVAGPGRMTCASASQLAEHGAAPAVIWNAEGDVHLIGLAADGVAAVMVVYSDGTVQ